MATYNSQQLALLANQGGSATTKQIPAQERRQSPMLDHFNFNTTDETTSGTLADGDNIRLVKLLKGTKLIKIRAWFEAMGANMTADFGLEGADGDGTYDGTNSDDPNFFTTAAIDVSAAGESDAAVLQEDNPGYVLLKDCYLTVNTVDSVGSNPWAADKDFDGYVEYLSSQ